MERPKDPDVSAAADRCETCRFVLVVGVNKERLQKIFECRRYPPHPQVIPGPNGAQTVSVFPPTQSGHTCGEYSPIKLVLN